MATQSLTYLIPRLRLQIGDTDPGSYRYLDEWLELALVVGVESLQAWWNYKYLIGDDNRVYRNVHTAFLFPEPPVIQRGDTRPIVLMASILLKSGNLENFSWNVGSWRDAEISYSNIEGSRGKDKGIDRDWEELKSILSPPGKKLAFPQKGHLPGFIDNLYEDGEDQ